MSYILFKDISQADCIRGAGKTHQPTGYLRKSRHNHVYYAHRLAYSDANGGIPEGYHVHHLCDNKVCINPNHLVALTPSEHKEVHTKLKSAEYYTELKTCKLGHPLDGKNKKQRYCLTCHRKIGEIYRAKPEIKLKQREHYLRRKALTI